MKILVNGAWRETQRCELFERARTTLADGDRVEVLAPMQGG